MTDQSDIKKQLDDYELTALELKNKARGIQRSIYILIIIGIFALLSLPYILNYFDSLLEPPDSAERLKILEENQNETLKSIPRNLFKRIDIRSSLLIDEEIIDIKFSEKNILTILGSKGSILTSLDEGETWKSSNIISPPYIDEITLDFHKSLGLITDFEEGGIYGISSDGGKYWNTILKDSRDNKEYSLNELSYLGVTNKKDIVVKAKDRLIFTYPGENYWKGDKFPVDKNYKIVEFNKDLILLEGIDNNTNENSIRITVDNGSNWIEFDKLPFKSNTIQSAYYSKLKNLLILETKYSKYENEVFLLYLNDTKITKARLGENPLFSGVFWISKNSDLYFRDNIDQSVFLLNTVDSNFDLLYTSAEGIWSDEILKTKNWLFIIGESNSILLKKSADNHYTKEKQFEDMYFTVYQASENQYLIGSAYHGILITLDNNNLSIYDPYSVLTHTGDIGKLPNSEFNIVFNQSRDLAIGTSAKGDIVLFPKSKGFKATTNVASAAFKNAHLNKPIFNIGSKSVVISGTNGALYTSKDDGFTWSPIILNTNENLSIPQYSTDDSQFGVIFGHQGTIYITLDGGHSWQSVIKHKKSNGKSVVITKDLLGFQSKDGEFTYSLDKGNSWYSYPYRFGDYELISTVSPKGILFLTGGNSYIYKLVELPSEIITAPKRLSEFLKNNGHFYLKDKVKGTQDKIEELELIVKEQLSKQKVTSFERVEKLSIRIGILAIIMFSVQLLINNYRYCIKLGDFYHSRASSLKVVLALDLHNNGTIDANVLMSQLAPEIEFGKQPSTPVDSVITMASKVKGTS